MGFKISFKPYSAATSFQDSNDFTIREILSNIQFFGSSVQYIPVAILIFIYSGLLRKSEPNLSRGLFIGASILCLSIVSRTIDEPLCSIVSVGTHFV